MNMEEEFFLYFKKQLFNEDIIKIPESFVLNKLNNKLKIFYNVNSIWFSRLKVSDEETYYYFGLYDENCINENIIQPKILLKSNPKKVSSLRFLKNDCYILIRLSDNSEELKKLKKSFYLKKSENKNFYYLNLGNLNSKSLIINITYFLNEFDFKINLKNNYILISKSFKVPKQKKKFSSASKVQNNNNIISDDVYRRRTLELFHKIDFKSDIYLDFVKSNGIANFSPQQQYDYLYSNWGYEKLYDTLKDIKLKITLERREREKKEYNKIIYNQKKELEREEKRKNKVKTGNEEKKRKKRRTFCFV